MAPLPMPPPSPMPMAALPSMAVLPSLALTVSPSSPTGFEVAELTRKLETARAQLREEVSALSSPCHRYCTPLLPVRSRCSRAHPPSPLAPCQSIAGAPA
jgi:hypothetical protein